MHTAHTVDARVSSGAAPTTVPTTAMTAAMTAATPPAATATYDDMVLALHEVARRIDGLDAGAGALLQALMGRLQAHPDARCTGLMVFAAAMAERLADASADIANLYLRRFETPQIALFDLLGRHMPALRMATTIANDLLLQALAGDPHPTLIDVGIGTGRQVALLLQTLAAADALPDAITVIGIEPALDALDMARRSLLAEAAALGVRLRFHGFAATAEALEDADWRRVAAACSGAPVINASFALHHIADGEDGVEQRGAVLRRLHALQPRCLVLSEPDVDHLEPRFLPRFRHCFAHFSAAFHVLDTAPMAQAERDALKVGFFGREISDVLGTPEGLRSERHERAAAWVQRLRTAGFVLAPAAVALPPSPLASLAAVQAGPRIALTVCGQPLVSILVARPATPPGVRA